jgi:hypothetical protein
MTRTASPHVSSEPGREAAARSGRERCAAPKTVEVLIYSLRDRGDAALGERSTLQRLGELSTEQLRQVIGRLMRARRRYPAITDQLLVFLGDLL